MQERFKQLLGEKKLTATRFAALIKVNASAMSHILNGRSKPGFDILDKIARAFPDVNLNWLISGNGSLYNNSPLPEKPRENETLFSASQETFQTVSQDSTEHSSPVSKVIRERKEIPSKTIATAQNKIKRIILFFEDGSFEDYVK